MLRPRRAPRIASAVRPCVESLEHRTLLSLPPGFAQTTFATGLSAPTAMAFAPDGRLFVLQQNGQLRVVGADGNVLPTPFATVPARSGGEQGALSFAFAPDFSTSRQIFLHWITSAALNRISRFTADASNPNVAAAGSQVDIVTLPDAAAGYNHQGGALGFGADGKLYVAIGEHGNPALAQNPTSPFGKVLRLNTDGSFPADNPFYGSSTGWGQAVWASGLRNPFTFAFQPGTGRLIINDVGGGLREEANLGRAGANYGWPTTEGKFDASTYPQFTNPVYDMITGDSGIAAIIGATFNNPPAGAANPFPATYAGKYFFSDYAARFIRVLDPDNGYAMTVFGTQNQLPPEMVDLEFSPDGNLYALARGSGAAAGAGTVVKISYTGSDAPVISSQPASRTVTVGQPVTFTVTASGAAPLAYQWQRNGTDIAGATSASYTISATTAGDGGAQFRCVVTNPSGSATSSAATLTVTSNQPPVATINTPASGALYTAGDTVSFSGAASDPEDGTLPASAYTWWVDFHHDTHTHPHVAPTSGQASGNFFIPTVGETSANVWYRIHLQATDSQGLRTEATRDVRPRTANVTLATSPAGLSLNLDGAPQNAPLSFTGVAGIVRQLGAPATQAVGGVTYELVSWSDGGAAAHSVSTPATNTTFTATYRAVSQPPPPPPPSQSTGFFVDPQTQGTTPVTLYPIEAVAPGATTRVSFGVPFGKGFLDASRLDTVRLLTPAGAEVPARVTALTPWRDMATLTNLNSVRSALVQVDVAFPDVDSDGDADPLAYTVEWGRAASAVADPAVTDVRANWVQYNNAAAPAGTDYKTVDNVFEPPAYALFTPEWYGQSLLKTRLLPFGSDPNFAGNEAAYANFAGTAINDVDPRVTEANLIHYTTTDREPWLFDRATAFYQLAFRSGNVKYLRQGHRAAQFYANHISPQGYFDLAGEDIKYVTGEAISIDYWLTGDGRMVQVHQTMNPMFDRGHTAAYTPGRFWTERHSAYKLLGYVTGYELLGDPALGQKARDTFTTYINHQNNPPAGAPNTGMLMHQSQDHGEGGPEWIASPWMSALLIDAVERYYVHSGDARVANFVTRMADGINQLGDSMYYSSEFGGSRLMPFYLAGPGLTADQHAQDPYGDMEHGTDVSKIFALAYYFTRQAGAPSATYLGRMSELKETGQTAFNYWTRPGGPASGLAVYRLTPARKFNWWFRTTAGTDWLLGGAAGSSPDTERPGQSLAVQNVTSGGGAYYQFTVTYTDNRAIATSTIDSNDIQVTGPNSYNQLAQLVSVDGTGDAAQRTATYRIPAPGGAWDAADNGMYGVNIRAGQIADTSGNLIAGQFLSYFTVNLPATNPGTPTAALTASPVTSAEFPYYYFTVTYSDDVGITWGSINTGDVEVVGPNGFSQVAMLANFPAGQEPTRYAVTYRLAAPGGSWKATDSGTYTVRVRASEVSDSSGNFVAAGAVGTFAVTISDSVAPAAAAATIPTVTTASSGLELTVTYSDAGGIRWRTLTSGDVVVTGPNGFSQLAELVNLPAGQDPKRMSATYRISAPFGAWGMKDNGTYTVSVRSGEVTDCAGNALPAGVLGTFDVAILDNVPPTVALTASDVTTSAAVYYFTVKYSDATGVQWKTLNTGDVEVSGPNGFLQVAMLANLPAGQDPKQMSATYRISAPGGSWTNGSNGTYTVHIRKNQVADTAGNIVPDGMLGTFQVAIPVPPPQTQSAAAAQSASFGASPVRELVQELSTPGAVV